MQHLHLDRTVMFVAIAAEFHALFRFRPDSITTSRGCEAIAGWGTFMLQFCLLFLVSVAT